MSAATEGLLDHFRGLSEKEKHDHILSLLQIVEVRVSKNNGRTHF